MLRKKTSIESANNNHSISKSVSKILKEESKEKSVVLFAEFVLTAVALDKYIRLQLRSSENPYSQAKNRIMHVLIANGGKARLTDISKEVNRTKCSVTRVLDNMEKDGLVKRSPVIEDHREKHIVITDKGLEIVGTTVGHRKLIFDKIIAGIDEQKIADLTKSLKKIKDNIRSMPFGLL